MNDIYIGNNYTYHDPLSNKDLDFIQGKSYDFEIQLEGPQIIVNGQKVITDDMTAWLIFGDIKVPYAPTCIPKNWKETKII